MPAPTGLCAAPAQPETVQGLSPCHRGHLLSWATSFLTELRSASRTSCTTVRSYSDRIWGHKPGAARLRCAPKGAWAGLPPVPPRLPPVPQNGLLGGAWVAAGSAWGQREWRQPWAGDRSGGRAGGLGGWRHGKWVRVGVRGGMEAQGGAAWTGIYGKPVSAGPRLHPRDWSTATTAPLPPALTETMKSAMVWLDILLSPNALMLNALILSAAAPCSSRAAASSGSSSFKAAILREGQG